MADGMNFQIKLEDNTPKVEEAEKQAIERALFAIGIKAVEGATDSISGKYETQKAVDTGRLRASISFITPTAKGESSYPAPNAEIGDKLSGKADEKTVVVGSNVEYAEYVHDGTSRMPPRPFLREGIDKTKDDMKRQVEKIFKGEL